MESSIVAIASHSQTSPTSTEGIHKTKGPRTGTLVLRGASLRFVSMLINLVGTFFLLPFMIHQLGDYWYGTWALIGAVIVQYHILDFGLSQTVVRFIARFRAEKGPEQTTRVYSTALAAFGGFGLATFFLVLAVAGTMDYWVASPADAQTLGWTVLMVGATMCCAFPTYAMEGAFSGAMRQDIPSLLQIMRTVIRLSLTYYFIAQGYSIMALAAVSLGCDTLYRVQLILCLRRVVPEARFDRRTVSFAFFREMLVFGRYETSA
jgi:O-antigen/teichoic acid export membrane protein